MVFVPEGGGLQISGLRFSIGKGGELSVPDVTIKLNLDLWPIWLDVGMGLAAAAIATRGQLHAAIGHDDQIGPLLASECQASLVAIGAAAFALDAFYASVRHHVDEMASLDAVWGKSQTRAMRGSLRPCDVHSA